jgi:hypothetical protein
MDIEKIKSKIDFLIEKKKRNESLLSKNIPPKEIPEVVKPKLNDLKEVHFFSKYLLYIFIFSFGIISYFQYLFFDRFFLINSLLISLLVTFILRFPEYYLCIKNNENLSKENNYKISEYNKMLLKHEIDKKKYQQSLDEYLKNKKLNSEILIENNLLHNEIKNLVLLKHEELKKLNIKISLSDLISDSEYLNDDDDDDDDFELDIIPVKNIRNSEKNKENAKIIIKEIYCPNCGFKFNYKNENSGKIVGGIGGAVSGAILGAKVGIAMGPLGAISGTIPGAILGGVFGKDLGSNSDKPECPKCKTKFTLTN